MFSVLIDTAVDYTVNYVQGNSDRVIDMFYKLFNNLLTIFHDLPLSLLHLLHHFITSKLNKIILLLFIHYFSHKNHFN